MRKQHDKMSCIPSGRGYHHVVGPRIRKAVRIGAAITVIGGSIAGYGCATQSTATTTATLARDNARTTFFSSLIVDAAQTAKIRNTDNVYETNRLLGRKPDVIKTGIYFTAAAFIGDRLIREVDNEMVQAAIYTAVNVMEAYLILYNNPQKGISEEVRFTIPLIILTQ